GTATCSRWPAPGSGAGGSAQAAWPPRRAGNLFNATNHMAAVCPPREPGCYGAVETSCQPGPAGTAAVPAARPPVVPSAAWRERAVTGAPSTQTRCPARTPGRTTWAVAVVGTSTVAENVPPSLVNETLTDPRGVGTVTEPRVRLAGCGRISTWLQPGARACTPNRYCGTMYAGAAPHGWE